MAGKYTSILKNLDRIHSDIWKIIFKNKIRQSHWIKDLRWGLNMSARQLGQRMGVSSSTVRDMERREVEGTITLATLQRAAEAFDLKLFYLFVPKEEASLDNALQALIEKRAREVATEIIRRSAKTMQIEDQATSQTVNDDNIREMAAKLEVELPGSLWD
jgi:predicted DNA-binding mobile mystery protein A